jgi:hypothetical protein
LGPGVWFDYLHALPTISAITRHAHFSPMMEASFTGIASNLLWSAGFTAWEAVAMKIAYAVTVSAALVMLCRVVWSSSPKPTASVSNYEYACGVLFMMIVPPYFILYDQTLIAVPLVMLWSSPRWRWGVALFAATTVVAADLALVLGFSLTGLAVLATMFVLALQSGPSAAFPHSQAVEA